MRTWGNRSWENDIHVNIKVSVLWSHVVDEMELWCKQCLMLLAMPIHLSLRTCRLSERAPGRSNLTDGQGQPVAVGRLTSLRDSCAHVSAPLLSGWMERDSSSPSLQNLNPSSPSSCMAQQPDMGPWSPVFSLSTLVCALHFIYHFLCPVFSWTPPLVLQVFCHRLYRVISSLPMRYI